MAGEEWFFLLYLGALLVTGVLFIVSAVVTTEKAGSRALMALLGVAAFGYLVYLLTTVFVNGGDYRIFFYAFVFPFLGAYQIYKALKERAAQKAASQDLMAQPAAGASEEPASPVAEG